MSDTQNTILNIDASADGRRNAFVLACAPLGQSMNYAACLNRVRTIAESKGPSDWAACAAALRCNGCPAAQMRQQEELAGKSIFFRARGAVATAAESARKWITRWSAPAGAPAAVPAPRKGRSALDAMGDLGSLADAVSATHASATLAPAVTPAAPPKPLPQALPGESPLQLALRLRKEREAAAS